MEEKEKPRGRKDATVGSVEVAEVFTKGQMENYELLFKQCDKDEVGHLTLAEIEGPFKLMCGHRYINFDREKLKKLSTEVELYYKGLKDDKYFPALFSSEQFLKLLAVFCVREGYDGHLTDEEANVVCELFEKNQVDGKIAKGDLLEVFLRAGQYGLTNEILDIAVTGLFGNEEHFDRGQFTKIAGAVATHQIILTGEGDIGPNWCSHCKFVKTLHHPAPDWSLVRRGYMCKRCNNRTVCCIACPAMAKGGRWWDDIWCSVCNSEIASWSNPHPNRGACHCT